MTKTDEYVFTNLRTLTIHRNASHRSCNDSSYIGFHGDFIITEAENNPGEFQAWQMETTGCYWRRKSKVQPVPWELPLHDGVTWETPFSRLWRDLEIHKYRLPTLALKTVRFVSFGKGPDHWASRLDFLTGKKYVQSTGCIYEGRKTLDTLLHWSEADSDGTGWYGYLTSMLSLDDYDPIRVYLTQTPCECAIGHSHKAGFYDEDDLEDVKLRRAMAAVSESMNRRPSPPWQ
jgi:hypothetical protein